MHQHAILDTPDLQAIMGAQMNKFSISGTHSYEFVFRTSDKEMTIGTDANSPCMIWFYGISLQCETALAARPVLLMRGQNWHSRELLSKTQVVKYNGTLHAYCKQCPVQGKFHATHHTNS
jgi:hypothetical protein